MVHIVSFVKADACPTGWIEDTSFVDRIPAFDSTVGSAMMLGGLGSYTHSHTPPTTTINGDGVGGDYYRGFGAATITLLPPYLKVKFCKQIYMGQRVPSNTLHMFDGSCPIGFTSVSDYNNRQPMGAAASLGTLGSYTGAHAHSVASSNILYTTAPRWDTTIAGGTTSTDNLVPDSTTLYLFVKVVLCRKS